LVFGFPGDLGFELAEQRPMARLGVIAMVAGESFLKARGEFQDADVRLIDAPIFGGNSGSPVFRYRPLGGLAPLLGLVTHTNIQLDYAVMEPVWRIAQTVEQASKAGLHEGVRWLAP
jgi:hypothetical protein